jgi:hypothetical protein
MITPKSSSVATSDLTPFIGRCTSCKRAFRADLSCLLMSRIKAPNVYPGLGGCDCRVGKRCVEGENGLPDCRDWECAGHDVTEVIYRRLTVVYSAEAVCGPGHCHDAITASCVCSCGGKNHGKFWLTNVRI